MRRWFGALFCALSMLFTGASLARDEAIPTVPIDELPAQARETLELIKKGGPFKYERDGIVFGNFEKRLPVKAKGYYHEYTVPTPGVKNRGARRIIAGGKSEYFYTDDHYNSFKRIRE